MPMLELIATATFGLEAVVKRELMHIGYTPQSVSDGKVTFEADERAIPRANLWLRSADRVLLKMGEFPAGSFDDLFEHTRALPWSEWIPLDGSFPVTGKSIKSKLSSVPTCQAIVKKAVVENLKRRYRMERFPETGPSFPIQVALLNDTATLTIDTSGTALHKRGYRHGAVEAPLKETLAAAMIELSYWNRGRVLVDPLCGSGTIPIEAAMIGRNIAPGSGRRFAAESWPSLTQGSWKEARMEAYQSIDQEARVRIIASDIDSGAVRRACENARQAGVGGCIEFSATPLHRIEMKEDFGVVITNPPYGERIGEGTEVKKLYRQMGRIFRANLTWSVYILSPEERFEKLYGAKADRKRKLFNGSIKVNYYQFYGPRPPTHVLR